MAIRSRIFRYSLNMLLVAGIMFFAAGAGAAGKSSTPIRIEADRMVSREQTNSVLFTGHVDARQGDLVIRTDEMTVLYAKNKNKTGKVRSGSGKVWKLLCKGNVEITKGDWLGTGKRMEYLAADRKIILSGGAKAWQGKNMVAGKTITYYLDEGRSVVEQNKRTGGRVEAVIHPESDAR